jgi:hypothetical protein
MSRFIHAALITTLLAGTCSAVPDRPVKTRPQPSGRVGNPRVDRLFAAMRAGTASVVTFPKLGWEDIPALLRRAGSATRLTSFPGNPISSTAVRECSEGMVALWLIEGLRKGGDFPSLTPLCLQRGSADRDWQKASEASHPALADQYRAWWQKVKFLPPAKAAAIDPLSGTPFFWH